MRSDAGASAIRAVAHYENFPVASWLVPASLRAPIASIYRFARFADDVADEGDAARDERLAELAMLGRAIRGTASHPVVDPLERWRAIYDLPAEPFLALLSAFEQDVRQSRYESDPALLDYCRRSANPVGELVLRLFGCYTPENARASDAICTALQLINFLQDIAEDWSRGRIYLPLDAMSMAGVDESDIAGAAGGEQPGRALCALIASRARDAGTLLESGAGLCESVPFRLGLELRAILAGGLRVLERLERAGYDPFGRRVRLSWFDALAIARLFARSRRRTPVADKPARGGERP